MNDRHTQQIEVRIDKWLWAARFFKTRALAAEAVAGGKVALNGARPKPSRMIRPAITSTSVAALTNGPSLSKERPPTEVPSQTPMHSTKRPKKADQEGKPPLPNSNSNGQPILTDQGGLQKRIGARYRNSLIGDGEPEMNLPGISPLSPVVITNRGILSDSNPTAPRCTLTSH